MQMFAYTLYSLVHFESLLSLRTKPLVFHENFLVFWNTTSPNPHPEKDLEKGRQRLRFLPGKMDLV